MKTAYSSASVHKLLLILGMATALVAWPALIRAQGETTSLMVKKVVRRAESKVTVMVSGFRRALN